MGDIIGVILFMVFFVGCFVAVIVNFAVKAAKSNKKDQQQQANTATSHYQSTGSTSSGKTVMTEEQRRRLEYLRQQQQQKTATEKHELHVQDAHEHAHMGEEEHYEEIVGSLGDINDEGCEDLSGVRFIVNDLAYDTSNNEHADYANLAKAMVLGEVINSPRFKSPYGKK